MAWAELQEFLPYLLFVDEKNESSRGFGTSLYENETKSLGDPSTANILLS